MDEISYGWMSLQRRLLLFVLFFFPGRKCAKRQPSAGSSAAAEARQRTEAAAVKHPFSVFPKLFYAALTLILLYINPAE